MDFSKRLKPVAKHSIFDLPNGEYIVWCGAITKADDGLFYLYFSFWPKHTTGSGWLTHSQIGYATSESPTGPFTYGGIALAGAGGAEWDRDCVHNPAILKLDGVYYLYYMGNYGDGEYWNHRNHQRIGVAYSDNPKGPFKRFDKPVIDVTDGSFDGLMTSNPTVCVGPDKKIYMMYKAVSQDGEMPKGGDVICGMAVAEHPLGEFVKRNEPILQNPEYSWSVEDPFLWYEDGRFYAIAKDFNGTFTNSDPGTVALFESEDGFDWHLCEEHPLACKKEILWEDGSVLKLNKMERPQMWLDETGKPSVLSCACQYFDNGEELTFNVQFAVE
ncbi:MAG: glycoside hydrolase family protein [Clostridia bacterium]